MRDQLGKAYRAMSGRHRNRSENLSRPSRPSQAAPVCHMEPLEDRQFLSTYYVSPSGSDSASGKSTSAAWRTVNRVNSQKLNDGDKVLFKGGSSFSGSLYVPSSEGGTSSNPVVFSSYGSGRATIHSGAKPASTSPRPPASPSAISISSARLPVHPRGSTSTSTRTRTSRASTSTTSTSATTAAKAS